MEKLPTAGSQKALITPHLRGTVSVTEDR